MTWPLLLGTAWLLVSTLIGLTVGGAIRSAEGDVPPPGREDAARDERRPAVHSLAVL